MGGQDLSMQKVSRRFPAKYEPTEELVLIKVKEEISQHALHINMYGAASQSE